ncbi:MAG: hypothetical protein RLZZ350_2701 [Verrucomicrobiota bacterium]
MHFLNWLKTDRLHQIRDIRRHSTAYMKHSVKLVRMWLASKSSSLKIVPKKQNSHFFGIMRPSPVAFLILILQNDAI